MLQTTEGQSEKKFKLVGLQAPTFFDRKQKIFIRKAIMAPRYKNDDGTRFSSWTNMKVEFCVCRSPWGPDLLRIMYRTDSDASRFTLEVHRKQQDAKDFRVVYRHDNVEVDLTATETEEVFSIQGPEFELVLSGQDKERPGEIVYHEAERVSVKLNALFNDAIKRIEARVHFLYPTYCLKRVIFLNRGQRRLIFAAEKLYKLKVDLMITEEPVVSAKKVPAISDELLVVNVHSHNTVVGLGTLQEALEGLDKFLPKLKLK